MATSVSVVLPAERLPLRTILLLAAWMEAIACGSKTERERSFADRINAAMEAPWESLSYAEAERASGYSFRIFKRQPLA